MNSMYYVIGILIVVVVIIIALMIKGMIKDIWGDKQTKPHILIIDDELNIIQPLEDQLTMNDFKISYALSIAEGMEEILKNPPDLIICKHAMSTEQEGYQALIIWMRNKDERINNIPVFSMQLEDKVSQYMHLRTIDRRLIRPFDLAELVEELKNRLC